MKKEMKKLMFGIAFLMPAFLSAQTLKDAIKLTTNEQYEKASAIYKTLLAADKTGDVYYYYGENYFNNDNQDSAGIVFNDGLAKFPGNPMLMAGAGKCLALKGNPADGKGKLFAADTYVSDKNCKLGNAQKVTAYIEIARAYTQTDNPQLAITVLNKALKIDDKNAELYIAMGDALYKQDPLNGTPIIQQYKKAVDLDKTSAKALFKTGELYLFSGNSAAYDECLIWIEKAIALDPTFAPAWRVKGDALGRKNKFEDAIKAYQQYLSLNSNNLSARVQYCKFLYIAKKYADLITEIKAIQKDYPNTYPNVLNRLMGFALYETGDYPLGLTTMDLFFSKQPENKLLTTDFEYYGRLLSKSGQDSLAVDFYKKAIKKDSTQTDLWSEIGAIYYKQKKYADAAVAYRKKIDGKKGLTANDWFYLGRAHYMNKQYVKADSCFIEYTAIQKDLAFGYLWRAKCNTRIDSNNVTYAGKPYYEKAIQLSKPDEVEKSKTDYESAYFYLGLAYYKTKEYGYAKCCFMKVLDFKLKMDQNKKGQESNYVLAKNSLDLPELKNATSAPDCIKVQ